MQTLFQKIINREIKSDILYEDDNVIAIYDINPKSRGHFLVIPKTFSDNLITIEEDDFIVLLKVARKLANEEIKKLGVSGYRLQVNNGKESGQEIFHTHVHIIPSKK